MLPGSDRARLEFVIQAAADIQEIVKRHGDARRALADVEGRPALLMCLQQIGESLFRLEEAALREKLPVSQAYTMRNVIAHNYLGVNIEIIAQTIEQSLPALCSSIREHLSGTQQ